MCQLGIYHAVDTSGIHIKKSKNSFMLNNTFCIAKKEKEIFFLGLLAFCR
jgi:hypothetical protein